MSQIGESGLITLSENKWKNRCVYFEEYLLRPETAPPKIKIKIKIENEQRVPLLNKPIGQDLFILKCLLDFFRNFGFALFSVSLSEIIQGQQ